MEGAREHVTARPERNIGVRGVPGRRNKGARGLPGVRGASGKIDYSFTLYMGGCAWGVQAGLQR
eukprot:3680760-Prymnesium_polylepis.1